MSTEALALCQKSMETLLAAVNPTRTTLRVEDAAGLYPVVAEGLSPGTNSLVGAPIGIRATKTFVAMEEQCALLLQEDLLNPAPGIDPPMALIQVYGAKSQMLCAVMKESRCVAFVSVHEGKGTRKWSEKDVEAIKRATREANDALGLGGEITEKTVWA
ncbi:hypothetical protein MNV49_001143 [Pseudohyphozyma bogoriensis]|nr:hypothetical protein MNV49_001143 [Pseudohyphozyma bogoriensis]